MARAGRSFDDHQRDALVAVRYVDGMAATEHYPENPNGSPEGITGLCNADGRVTIMMPHPERLLRTVNFSWAPRTGRNSRPGCGCFSMPGSGWNQTDVVMPNLER
jgi:phosphoribosylformylglycinamidine (FGAM) synthase-like amidotransferase family enzyme